MHHSDATADTKFGAADGPEHRALPGFVTHIGSILQQMVLTQGFATLGHWHVCWVLTAQIVGGMMTGIRVALCKPC